MCSKQTNTDTAYNYTQLPSQKACHCMHYQDSQKIVLETLAAAFTCSRYMVVAEPTTVSMLLRSRMHLPSVHKHSVCALSVLDTFIHECQSFEEYHENAQSEH